VMALDDDRLQDDDDRYELPQGKVPGEWADRGACVGKPPEWFFPERGQAFNEAKALCGSCPVQPECLEHAVRNGEKFGIWGGRSERQRRKIRRAASTQRKRGDT